MKSKRAAGILLHPTSLPGKFGIGDLGPNAYKLLIFFQLQGKNCGRFSPLVLLGTVTSPYQCLSAFAGNPMLISPEVLLNEGLLSDEDADNYPSSNKSHIDFGELINNKTRLLKKAFKNFKRKNYLTIRRLLTSLVRELLVG
jgi:4-alpha-glucanotransferase